MHWVDWGIVAITFLPLIWVLIRSNREVRNSSDFLTAGRCAGRYLLTISGGIANFGLISAVAMFEMYYNGGLSPIYWMWATSPLVIVLTLCGWIFYRYRETRCMTMAQFFELRYNRGTRILAGILAWVAGILNYGIFPAVSARFFLYFCDLPDRIDLGGGFVADTYTLLLLVIVATGVGFAVFGGQIAIMVTDFLQGMFCNIAFLILAAFFVLTIDYDALAEALTAFGQSHPGQSFVNPFNTGKVRDFNLWYFAIGWFGVVFGGIWQGSSGYQTAARTPHEAKMAGLLSPWRGVMQNLLMIVIPMAALLVLTHPSYSGIAAEVNGSLERIGDEQIRSQMLIPVTLSRILPIGLTGLFAAVMVAAMVSTDNTYLHSWGSIFIQDVVMPFRRRPFEPATHLLLLRCSIVGVGIFAFFFSLFFRQTEHILLFFAITGAIFSGSGAVIVGGLYTRWGTAAGAAAALIVGAVISLASILLQNFWPDVVRVLLEVFSGNRFLLEHQNRFPINGQVVYFICIVSALVSYMIFSVDGFRNPFNLEKMLHRGKYAQSGQSEMEARPQIPFWQRLSGITPEFTRSDKMIAWAAIGWTGLWLSVFFTGLGLTLGGVLREEHWMRFWFWYLGILFVIGVISTGFFAIFGMRDIISLYRTLGSMKRNNADDGRIIAGHNAGEEETRDGTD